MGLEEQAQPSQSNLSGHLILLCFAFLGFTDAAVFGDMHPTLLQWSGTEPTISTEVCLHYLYYFIILTHTFRITTPSSHLAENPSNKRSSEA